MSGNVAPVQSADVGRALAISSLVEQRWMFGINILSDSQTSPEITFPGKT